ncbi:MAG: LAGLIDADG family homing endonuclease, partial [Candidatus Woesearchaeota archaeon]
YVLPTLIITKAKWFREFLCNCGIEKGTNKHINVAIMNSSLDKIKYLLQGLYDTDGYVQKSIKAVGFSNTSIKLIKNVQKLLLRFGIVTMLRVKKPSKIKIFNKEYPTKKSFELLIVNKRCLKIFQEKINFIVSRKKESLSNIMNEINSNINYFECSKCNYRIYYDLFSGRTKKQKLWGEKKLKVINILGKYGELKSRDLKKILGFLPRHEKGNRLNHHYYLILKKKFSKNEWIWSLNSIGKYLYEKIFIFEKNFRDFFLLKNCPICKTNFKKIIKKGWRDSDFEGDIFWDKIKKIEKIGKEKSKEVYDVVLLSDRKNKHYYVAEGFLIHNSYGLNLPAFRAIIKDLKRYGNYGMDWIPTLEYHQMAGRAGRPDFNDKFGEAICIANNEKDVEEILDRFINAPAEKIYSKLAVEPVLRTYCLSLLAIGYCKTKQDLINFFEKTFYGKQYGDIEKLGKIIDKILNYLDEWQFIELPETEKHFNKNKKEKNQKNDLKIKEVDFLSANDLYKNNKFKNNDEKDKILITKIGQRVSELYIDPYTANNIINALNIANNKTNNKQEANENSFIHLVSSTLELRPLPTVRVSEIDEIEKNIEDFPFIIEKPNYFDAEYDDFLRAMKLTFALIDWMNEKTEDYILNKYNISPGELNAKKELGDWILFAIEELCHLLGFMDLLKIIKKTRYRLEKGIKEELIPLTRLTGIGRVRARLLYKNGIKDIGDIKKTDLSVLSHLLGKKIAENLKNETGEIKEPVSENKRKGQLGLGKFE